MTPEQFAYWLQGFAEISQKAPTDKEWTIIKDHLATVFNKITPNRQPYPLGPAIAEPATKPIEPWPKPVGPYTTNPYTTTPNWPRPEVICSVAQGADTNWSSGAGDPSYSFFMTSTQEKNKKLNERLK